MSERQYLDEIDRLVAIHVMGWHQVDIPQSEHTPDAFSNWCDESGRGMVAVSQFRPSTEWAHAGMVFERCGNMALLSAEAATAINVGMNSADLKAYTAGTLEFTFYEVWLRDCGSDSTPCLAICLGALRKHGIEPPKVER